MTFRILSGLALVTGCITGGPRVTTTLPPVPIACHVHVRIAVDDGSVRVTSADITQVEMEVVSRGYDVARDLDLSITPHGTQVDIVAKSRHDVRMFNFTYRSLRLEIRIPRDADVEVSSGDGSVEVEQVAGNVDIRTNDGHVAVSDAHGWIRLHTGDGSIRGQRLDGAIDASTGDGSVHLDGRFDALAVATRDGRVIANAWPGSRMLQPWHVQTGDGSVALGLPRDLGAHIDASTGDGRVRSAFPLAQRGSSRAEGDINGGGPPIIVRSGDGSIRLTEM